MVLYCNQPYLKMGGIYGIWGNVGSARLVFPVVLFWSPISQSDVIWKGRQANVEQVEGDEDRVDGALWDPVGMVRCCARYFPGAMPKPCADAFLGTQNEEPAASQD